MTALPKNPLPPAWIEPATEPTLRAPDGASASLERDGERACLRVRDRAGALLFEYDQGRVTLYAPEGDLTLRAPQGKVRIEARDGLAVEGSSLEVAVERVRYTVGVFEVRASRILERAREVYREAEGLSQTRAGRVRIVAEQAFHLLGERLQLKSRTDVKIKGEKIYLA